MTPTKYFSLRNIISSKFIRQMIHFFLILIYPTLPLERRKKHLCVFESVAEMFSKICLYTDNALSLHLCPTLNSHFCISAWKSLIPSSVNSYLKDKSGQIVYLKPALYISICVAIILAFNIHEDEAFIVSILLSILPIPTVQTLVQCHLH